MIPQDQWETMTPGQQKAAWMEELAEMLQQAQQRFLASLNAGSGAKIHTGTFNLVVTEEGFHA